MKPDFALDPLRPQAADWETEIARLQAQALRDVPKAIRRRT
jgi:hypothetical protein